eukprot:532311-Karenia_brevis.AAC.1
MPERLLVLVDPVFVWVLGPGARGGALCYLDPCGGWLWTRYQSGGNRVCPIQSHCKKRLHHHVDDDDVDDYDEHDNG